MAQKPGESEPRKVQFPQVIRHRKAEATIYGKSRQYPRYRLGYYVAGQRRLRTFATFSEAKAEAERTVRELAAGSKDCTVTVKANTASESTISGGFALSGAVTTPGTLRLWITIERKYTV